MRITKSLILLAVTVLVRINYSAYWQAYYWHAINLPGSPSEARGKYHRTYEQAVKDWGIYAHKLEIFSWDFVVDKLIPVEEIKENP